MTEMKEGEISQPSNKSEIRDGVTLIDFNADWCLPCQEQAPILKRIAEKFKGKANILDLNVDRSPTPAMALGVTSIPTMILFKKGDEVERFIGKQSEAVLTRSLRKALADS